MRSVSAVKVRLSSDGELEDGEGLVLSRKEDDSSPLTEAVFMSYVAVAANQRYLCLLFFFRRVMAVQR